MANGLIKCLYRADDGNYYRVTIRRLDPVDLFSTWGFTADNPAYPTRPKWLKMRRAALQGFHFVGFRQVAVGNRTCYVWTHTNERVDLAKADGTRGDYYITSHFGEVIRKHI